MLKQLAARIKTFLSDPRVYPYLPKRKVLVGGLAGLLALGARKAGLGDALPAGYTEVAAIIAVGYLVPEPPPVEEEPVSPLPTRVHLGVLPPDADQPEFNAPFSGTPLEFHPDEPLEGEEDVLRNREEGPGLV